MGIFSPFGMMSGANTPSGHHDSDAEYMSPKGLLPRRKKTLEPGTLEEGAAGHEGDMEDNHNEGEGGGGKKTKRRSTWMNINHTSTSSPSGSKPSSRNVSRKNSSIPLQESPLHHYPPTLPLQGKPGESSGSGTQTPASSGRQTPVHLPHFDGQQRKSEDALRNDGRLLHTAGKALKSAVLHDARNMTGKGNHEEAAVGFGLNSPHEAKVHL